MIGLLYLAPVVIYGIVTVSIYGSLRERSRGAARVWAAIAVAVPAWLIWGYQLSSSYREFRAGCETDAGAHIVNPVPTNIPYLRFCNDAMRILPNSGYAAIECEQRGKPVRLTFDPGREGLTADGSQLIDCGKPPMRDGYHGECFEREPVDEISTPFVRDRERVRTVESRWSAGILTVTDTRVRLADETMVGYWRYYAYLPYGDRAWLGGSSGMAPRIRCRNDAGYLQLTDMFPPSDRPAPRVRSVGPAEPAVSVTVAPATPDDAAVEAPVVYSSNANVHAIGVYRAKRPPGSPPGVSGKRERGDVVVKVIGTGEIILVLSAYEPVRWIVQSRGAQVEQVVTFGFHEQEVIGVPRSTAVVANPPLASGDSRIFAYERDARFMKLERAVLELTGRPVHSFQGNYNGEEFVVRTSGNAQTTSEVSTIHRSVDDDGVVTYSDQPGGAAKDPQ